MTARPFALERSIASDEAEPGLPLATCLLEAGPAEPIEWLAENFLLHREITLLAGDGGSYKTTVALAIAAAVAGGRAVLGAYPTSGPAPVLFVSEEDGLSVIQNRVEALITGMQLGVGALVLSNLHVLALEGVQLSDLAWTLHLESEVRRLSPALVVFDPLADLLGENENDPTAARPVLQHWRRLTRLGAAVLANAHLGKPKEGQNGAHRVRGASSWPNGARAVYALEPRDGGLWMRCEKLSRAERPAPVELSLAIVADPDNRAAWVSAKIEAPRVQEGWAMVDRRQITPSERKILTALDRHQGEPLTWSKLGAVSGVTHNALSEGIHRLAGLGFLVREPAGKHAGRPQFSHAITGEGLAALLNSSNSSSTPVATPEEPPRSTPQLLSPLKGGEMEELKELETGPDSNSSGELEPLDEAYLESLANEEGR